MVHTPASMGQETGAGTRGTCLRPDGSSAPGSQASSPTRPLHLARVPRHPASVPRHSTVAVGPQVPSPWLGGEHGGITRLLLGRCHRSRETGRHEVHPDPLLGGWEPHRQAASICLASGGGSVLLRGAAGKTTLRHAGEKTGDAASAHTRDKEPPPQERHRFLLMAPLPTWPPQQPRVS